MRAHVRVWDVCACVPDWKGLQTHENVFLVVFGAELNGDVRSASIDEFLRLGGGAGGEDSQAVRSRHHAGCLGDL